MEPSESRKNDNFGKSLKFPGIPEREFPLALLKRQQKRSSTTTTSQLVPRAHDIRDLIIVNWKIVKRATGRYESRA